MAFRNGLRVPKLTHSASQQENSVTVLVASQLCLGLFPLRSEQWGAAGWFYFLCQHSNLMMTHGLLGYWPAEVTALQKY